MRNIAIGIGLMIGLGLFLRPEVVQRQARGEEIRWQRYEQVTKKAERLPGDYYDQVRRSRQYDYR